MHFLIFVYVTQEMKVKCWSLISVLLAAMILPDFSTSTAYISVNVSDSL